VTAIWAIAMKDMKLLLRDRGNFFFTFIFPVLFAVFFGVIFSGAGGGSSGGMQVAVWNEDGGPASNTLVAGLESDDVLKVHLPATREAGETLLRKGTVSALVVIPKGFEAQSRGLFMGQAMELETYVDPAQRAAAGMLQGKLTEKAFQVIQRTFMDGDALRETVAKSRAAMEADKSLAGPQRMALSMMMSAAEAMQSSGVLSPQANVDGAGQPGVAARGFNPVSVTIKELSQDRDGKPRSSFEISLGQGVVWGLMGCVTAFAFALVSEKTGGTMRRLSVAPIGPHAILLGKALACAIACVFVQLLLLAVMMALGVRVDRPHVMALVMLVNAVGFTGLMMLIAGLSTTEGGASGMGRGLILVLAMIGGGTVPLFFLPKWVQTAASVSPFKWSTLAIEGATWRALTMGELLLPLGILLAMALAGFWFGLTGLRRMLRA
jgi:ABC-2 type transport system permease protein